MRLGPPEQRDRGFGFVPFDVLDAHDESALGASGVQERELETAGPVPATLGVEGGVGIEPDPNRLPRLALDAFAGLRLVQRGG